MKKSLKEKMEEAPLHELMPDFDKEAGWVRLSAELHTSVRKPLFTWRRAAAVLILVAAAGLIALLATNGDSSANGLAQNNRETTHNWMADVMPGIPEQHFNSIAENSSRSETLVDEKRTLASNENNVSKKEETTRTRQIEKTRPTLQVNETHRTKEFVCNGTPCPLEICIIQTIRCKDQKPSEIATCNTLEPDQARQLHYKSPGSAGANCKVTIDEITIRRVTTGETIVLNAHSKPSTAQELFNCITGKEKCDLLAGIFENDCNNQQKSHSLKIDNNFGNLIMQ